MKRLLSAPRSILTVMAVVFLMSPPARCANSRVSVDAGGRQGSGASFDGVMSADGRWVAFATTTKFLAGDTNSKTDVYLKDTQTGDLRLVSDSRGGDQPSISADGRFVVYRGLYTIPQIRCFDRDGQIEPFTVSFPFGGGNISNRPADNAVISADGKKVAFVFRPSPNNSANRGCKIVVHTIGQATSFTLLSTGDVGRLSISGDGGQVFFESSDALDVADTNGARDVYMNDESGGGSNNALWISRPDGGQPQSESSSSPASVFDGGKVFFLSSGPLKAADTDGRTSVYRADISGDNVALALVPTDREPLGLSVHASPRGDFLGYLTKGNGGNLAPFVRELAVSTERSVSRQFAGLTSAPILGGDGSRMLFTAKSGFIVPGDTNGRDDVFLFDSLLGTQPNAPAVSVLNGAPANPINQFAGFSLNAAATAGTGALRFLSIDLNGDPQFSSNGAAIPNTAFSLATGFYRAEARAMDNDWITSLSAPATIIVMPSNTTAGITGVVSLTKTPQPDGTTLFNATLRVDNRRASATAALRLMVVESSTPTTMGPTFGDENLVPDRGQNIVAVADIGVLVANGTAEVDVTGVVSAVELVGEGFQGGGWIVEASLQEQAGQNFSQIDDLEIFKVAPQLEEDTPGPNGGIPVFGTPGGVANFSPPVLQSISITGPASVAELTRATFKATANFSDGSGKPCSPVWSLANAAGAATISASGVLAAGDVAATKSVQVRADFSGRSATPLTVNIKPVTPVISITADIARAAENGGAGRFKVTRSPLTGGTLDVAYTVAGKAANGTDYTQLSGTVQIPGTASRAFIDVTPTDDANFEGMEDVTVTLLPSSAYRLSAQKKATVNIVDDEAFPAGAVDAIIRRGTSPPVGREVIDGFVFPPQFPPTQTLAANGARNTPVTFLLSATNRDTVARTITVSGAVDSGGFSVRYFSGATDVSANVADGTFEFADVEPGTSVSLKLKITPGPGSAFGSSIRVITQFSTNTGRSDSVEAVLTRTQ